LILGDGRWMLARTAGMNRLSEYSPGPYQALYDYVGLEEHLRWLFEEFVDPRVHMVLNRMDDMMDNIVRAFGSKNFGTHYQDYWNKRREQQREQNEQRRQERNDRYGLSDHEETAETESVVHQAGQERSSTVGMENLERMAAMLIDFVDDAVQEHEGETGDALRTSLLHMQKEFESSPDSYRMVKERSTVSETIHLEMPSEIENRIAEVRQASQNAESILQELPSMHGEEVMSFRDMLETEKKTRITPYGDKVLDASRARTQEDFQEQGIQRLLDMQADKENPYVWNTPDEFKFALVEERYRQLGYGSLDELMAAESAEREKEDVLKSEMMMEKLLDINARRVKFGKKPIDMSQMAPVSDDEFVEWKKKRKS
jgi:hypothetical protein